MSMEINTGNKRIGGLTIAAIGVVFGDIGTSPLYALKESLSPEHGLSLTEANVMGILSVMFWAMMTLVTVKYILLMMRADNKGEGGILALTALAQRCFFSGSRKRWIVVVLGMFGAAMFFGDAVITPAISVLSAVEGLKIVTPAFDDFIVPLSIGILIGLFMIQKHGTSAVGRYFGPTMVIWFLVLALLGIIQIVRHPGILVAINPLYSWRFLAEHGYVAWFVLGSVVLCVTGGEALYGDMGHFGKKPIRMAWFSLVWPALMLNYFGQGAMLLTDPSTISNPFFLMAPGWALIPMIVIATCATVIASQAVISGAYSVTKQAIQLGYLPRFKILITSDKEMGQIYVPFTNWLLLATIILLVLTFKSSSNLASAYGIAVMLTMTINTLLLFLVMRRIWRVGLIITVPLVAIILANDLMFLSATMLRIGDGGWFPLLIGTGMFTLMSTWSRGRQLVRQATNESALPLNAFIESIALSPPHKVPGTGIFMSVNADGVPNALLHNLKHNKVLHERVVILSVVTEDIPYVPKEDYIWIEDLGEGFWRIKAHYGFKEQPDIPCVLQDCQQQGMQFEMMETTFFINRELLIATPDKRGMAMWREHLFVWMSHLATKASDYFRIPTNRVVELGTQVEI